MLGSLRPEGPCRRLCLTDEAAAAVQQDLVALTAWCACAGLKTTRWWRGRHTSGEATCRRTPHDTWRVACDAHVCAEDSHASPPAGSMLAPPSLLPTASGWGPCESAAHTQCSFSPVSCQAVHPASCCTGCRCIIDKVPRQLSAESCALLCNFAEMVVREIERDKVLPVLHTACHSLHHSHPTPLHCRLSRCLQVPLSASAL